MAAGSPTTTESERRLADATWSMLDFAVAKNVISISLPFMGKGSNNGNFEAGRAANVIIETILAFVAGLPTTSLKQVRFAVVK